MLQIAQFLQTKSGRKLRFGIGIILFIIAFALSATKGVMSSVAIFIGLLGLIFSFSGALGVCLIAPLVKSSVTGPGPKALPDNATQNTTQDIEESSPQV